MDIFKFQLSKLWMILIFVIMMDFPYMKSTDELIIKLIIIFFIFIAIFYRMRIDSLFKNVWPIFLYFSSIVLSAGINYGISEPFYRAVTYGLMLISIYITTYIAVKINGIEDVIEFLYKVIGIIVLIMDITVFATNGKGVDSSIYLANFMFGNKFLLAYFNMFFLCLYLIKKRSHTIFKKVALVIALSFVCNKAGSATGIVGIVTLFLLFILGKKLKRIMMNPVVFFTALIMSALLVVLFDVVISNSYIEYFVTNILNRSITMTGRMEIYQVLLPLIIGAKWVGYGHNNTAVVNLIGYGNAQNGVFNIFLNYGVIGIFSFAILCYCSLKKMKSEAIEYIYPVICFIYAMIICSTVEINLSSMFIFALILLRVSGGQFNERKIQGQCGYTCL